MSRFLEKSFNVDIDIELSEIFDEITDDELIQEVKERQLEGEFLPIVQTNSKNRSLYRDLCDIAEVSYHTDKEVLIAKIKELL